MKVGSLVECVKTIVSSTVSRFNCKIPVKGNIYTVRDVFTSNYNAPCIRLEEIVNPLNPDTGREFGYGVEYFRELQIPPSITAEIEECITRELQEV